VKWVNDRMTAQFPPGVFKEPEEVSL
jgi:hypothetical protein